MKAKLRVTEFEAYQFISKTFGRLPERVKFFLVQNGADQTDWAVTHSESFERLSDVEFHKRFELIADHSGYPASLIIEHVDDDDRG